MGTCSEVAVSALQAVRGPDLAPSSKDHQLHAVNQPAAAAPGLPAFERIMARLAAAGPAGPADPVCARGQHLCPPSVHQHV